MSDNENSGQNPTASPLAGPENVRPEHEVGLMTGVIQAAQQPVREAIATMERQIADLIRSRDLARIRLDNLDKTVVVLPEQDELARVSDRAETINQGLIRLAQRVEGLEKAHDQAASRGAVDDLKLDRDEMRTCIDAMRDGLHQRLNDQADARRTDLDRVIGLIDAANDRLGKLGQRVAEMGEQAQRFLSNLDARIEHLENHGVKRVGSPPFPPRSPLMARTASHQEEIEAALRWPRLPTQTRAPSLPADVGAPVWLGVLTERLDCLIDQQEAQYKAANAGRVAILDRVTALAQDTADRGDAANERLRVIDRRVADLVEPIHAMRAEIRHMASEAKRLASDRPRHVALQAAPPAPGEPAVWGPDGRGPNEVWFPGATAPVVGPLDGVWPVPNQGQEGGR